MTDSHEPQPSPGAPTSPPPPIAAASPSTAPPPPPRRGSGGATFGVILIVVGLIIIIDRIFPSVNLWELWPLIIVAGGVKQLFTNKGGETFGLNRVIEGLTTIAIGLILLGNTTGVLGWSLWLSVVSLWPLLLIAAGIDIIGKSLENRWLRSLSSLLILGGLLYGALILPAGTLNLGFGIAGPASEPFEFVEEADRRVDTGEASISGGVGELTIVAGDELATSTGATPFGEPGFEVTTLGSETEVDVSLGEDGFWLGYRGSPGMDVTLSQDVEWSMFVDSGVSRVDADLTDLDVRELQVKAGVSEVDITLGAPDRSAGIIPISVEAGVSTIRIHMPEDVDFNVDSAAGLSFISVDGDGSPSIGERNYRSEGWDDARGGYDIDLSSGIANVRVDFY